VKDWHFSRSSYDVDGMAVATSSFREIVTTSLSKSLRRTYRASNKRRKIASAAGLVAAVLVLAAAFRPDPATSTEPFEAIPSSAESTPAVHAEQQDEVSSRLIYRHSVVPGGVFSDGELRAAMRNDSVVAAHFTTLGRTRLRTEVVPHDRMVYVSYRKGNDIYWTRNKVLLRAGETILTDGRTQIRTRCGNCISDAPVTPVATDEPDVVEFEALVEDPPQEEENSPEVVEAPAGGGATEAPALMAGGGPAAASPAPSGTAPFVFPAAGSAPFVRWGGMEATPGSSSEPETPEAQPASDPDRQPPPAVSDPPPSDPPAGDDPHVTPPGPDVPLDPGVNPVPVPEPSTYMLVGGGIAALLRRMRRRNGKRSTAEN
jgi:hypothetical protein